MKYEICSNPVDILNDITVNTYVNICEPVGIIIVFKRKNQIEEKENYQEYLERH